MRFNVRWDDLVAAGVAADQRRGPRDIGTAALFQAQPLASGADHGGDQDRRFAFVAARRRLQRERTAKVPERVQAPDRELTVAAERELVVDPTIATAGERDVDRRDRAGACR